MKSLLRLLGLFQCSGGSGFVRMNAGVMFAWLTKLKEIGNGCGCLSLVRIGWEGFDLPPVSLCERVEAFPHPDPAVACTVARSSYNKPGAGGSAWEAALQNTPTEQRDSTNRPNVPSTVCSCFLCASTCCFSHFIPCFPTFSAAFLSLSLLFPVSGVAHTLKSLCEFFTHASAMSLPGARVPPARATPSVPLEEDAAAIRDNR